VKDMVRRIISHIINSNIIQKFKNTKGLKANTAQIHN